MNILFICDEYPPGNNGGIGTTVQNLGYELVKQGHKVVVAGLYAYRYQGKNYEVDNGVKVWRKRYGINLGLPSANKLYTVFERFPNFIKRKLNGRRAFRKFTSFVEETINTEKIDVIEIADFNNFAMYIGFCVQWPAFGVPLVLKSHGSYTYFCKELGQKPNPVFEKADRLLFERANAISCVSNHTLNINIALFGSKKTMRTIYNGVSIYAPVDFVKRKEQTVIFTGTLVHKKGIYALMKAWNIVNIHCPGAQLEVFGKGNTVGLGALLNKQAALTVKFKGHVNRTQLFENLSMATLAVFPSYSETFGMGVVEAMAMACPVIYTRRSCGPEIVEDGTDGLLVDPDNIEEIAQKIVQMLQNKPLLQKLAMQGYQSANRRFNIRECAVNNIVLYSEAINNFNQNKKEHRHTIV